MLYLSNAPLNVSILFYIAVNISTCIFEYCIRTGQVLLRKKQTNKQTKTKPKTQKTQTPLVSQDILTKFKIFSFIMQVKYKLHTFCFSHLDKFETRHYYITV